MYCVTVNSHCQSVHEYYVLRKRVKRVSIMLMTDCKRHGKNVNPVHTYPIQNAKVSAGRVILPLLIKDNPHFSDVQKLGSLDPATGIKSTRNSAALPNEGPEEMG